MQKWRRCCDRIVIIARGQVVAAGTPDELRETDRRAQSGRRLRQGHRLGGGPARITDRQLPESFLHTRHLGGDVQGTVGPVPRPPHLLLAVGMGPLTVPLLMLGIGTLGENRAREQIQKPLELPVVGSEHAPT